MATIVSKYKFAQMLGVHRSSVTRWSQEGRIVLTKDGRVAVEPSLERLRATELSDWVADRWRKYRRGKAASAEASETISDDDIARVRALLVAEFGPECLVR